MFSHFKKFGFLVLDTLKPTYLFLRGRHKTHLDPLSSFDEDNDLYLSGMISHFGFFHEKFFGPYFEKVRVDPAEIKLLKELSLKGTLVYVMKNRGQMEYSFFNHVFLKEDIPLARFANASRTLFWRPIFKIFSLMAKRLDYYYDNGLLDDPIGNGYLENLVTSGQSVLLNLKVSRDFLFGSGEDPLDFITPLIQAAKKSKKPVYIVTQQFLYDRHPEKTQRSIVDVILGDKIDPSSFRKILHFFLSYFTRASVKFGEPLDIKEFLSENQKDSPEILSTKFKAVLQERLSIERKSVTGPALMGPDKMLDKMLRQSSFKEDIEKLSTETNQSKEVCLKLAKKYFYEIAAGINYNYVDFYDKAIRWMVNNIYDGLDIDEEALTKIKAKAGRNPIVLVPCHRSHIDYLLISYVFYNYDITMPHICAGINLKFWPADGFIRKAGGFFIRRTFKGNKIYKLVIENYMKILLKEGYSMEFFIEGGRSRTGKLLKPKMGVLSMIIKGFMDGASNDIFFVPLAINYERILEHKSYLDEIKGEKKKKENMAEVLKAGKLFNKKYGKVFIRFAEPISLKGYLKEKGFTPKENSFESVKDVIPAFASRMTYEINRVSVVTSTALVALSILTYPRKGVPEEEILARAEILAKYLDFKQAKLSGILSSDVRAASLESLKRLSAERMIETYTDFEERFYTVDPARRMLLDYHKNSSLHFFVSISCFSKIIFLTGATEISFADLTHYYQDLKGLLKHEFTFSESAGLIDHLLKVASFFERQGFLSVDHKGEKIILSRSPSDPVISFLAGLLDNFYESLYLTALFIKHTPFEKMDRLKLEKSMLEMGEILFQKGTVKTQEALSQFNIHNAVDFYIEQDFIVAEEKLLTRNVNNNEAMSSSQNNIPKIGATGALKLHAWLELLERLIGVTPFGGLMNSKRDNLLALPELKKESGH